jgi:hypothetical protein
LWRHSPELGQDDADTFVKRAAAKQQCKHLVYAVIHGIKWLASSLHGTEMVVQQPAGVAAAQLIGLPSCRCGLQNSTLMLHCVESVNVLDVFGSL